MHRRTSLEDRREFLHKSVGVLAIAFAGGGVSSATGAPAASTGQVQEIRDPKTKIRIGVFDAAFHDLSTEQLIELIKEFKIEAVEIGSGNDPGNAHCDLEGLLADDAKRRAYAALFEGNGILISAFSCHGNPVHPNTDKARREDRVYRQTIDLAARMGVNRMVCFSGCPGDGTGKHPNWIHVARDGRIQAPLGMAVEGSVDSLLEGSRCLRSSAQRESGGRNGSGLFSL